MSARPTAAAVVFLAFAFAYFLSAMLRAVTATLAPVFSSELGLQASDLGLLAGAYFFGFAALQLPLGWALDRFGPRRTLIVLMSLAVIGCAGFALAPNLPTLVLARAITGAGLAAALMAPLTCYRRILSPTMQMRANSWMLMTGSLGMLASTLPVQWLLPQLGWRGLFWAVAALLLLAMAGVAWLVPRDVLSGANTDSTAGAGLTDQGSGRYVEIARHPLFRRLAPLAFVVYGGLIAVQSLWAGPWLTQVAGWSAQQAAQGLFGINLAMLLAFLCWGAVMPKLARWGVAVHQLITWGVLLALLLLATIVWLGAAASAWHWAAWCVACTFMSLSQPAVGSAFPAAQAGRALSAFNLVIFAGVFCVQWGLGLLIDTLRALGAAEGDAFRLAFSALLVLSACAYGWFLRGGRQAADNQG